MNALLAAALAFGSAWKVQSWRWAAADAERIAAEQENQRLRARTADKASEGHEADKEEARVEFKTIYQDVERIVERPVYRNVCLDADGLRRLTDAIAGPDRAAIEPAPAVPGPVGPH